MNAAASMLSVGRQESFSAAHQLRDPTLSEGENQRLFGKCVNLHGHNYRLEVVVTGATDRRSGFIVDLKMLSELIGREIIQGVDHRNLNTDVPWLSGSIPTAENLATAFWARLRAAAAGRQPAEGSGLGDGEELGRVRRAGGQPLKAAGGREAAMWAAAQLCDDGRRR